MHFFIPDILLMLFGGGLAGAIFYRQTLSLIDRDASKEVFDRWASRGTRSFFAFMMALLVYTLVWGENRSLPGPIGERSLILFKAIFVALAFPSLGIGARRGRSLGCDLVTNPFFPVFLIVGLSVSSMILSASHLLAGGVLIMVQGLAFLFMMLSQKNIRESFECCKVFYILYGMALGMYMIGCGVIFLDGYSLNMNILPVFSKVSLLSKCGIMLVLLSLGVMMGGMLYPLWSRQGLALSGLTVSHIMFWIVVVKSSILLYFLRLWGIFSPLPEWRTLYIGFVILGLAFSVFKSIKIDFIKRIFLNQSNIDFCLIFLSFFMGETPLALMILIVSLVTLSGVAFYISSLTYNDQALVSIKQLKGISSAHPALSLLLVFTILSLLMLVPTAGFFIKYDLLTLLATSNILIRASVGLLLVTSSFIYLRIIKFIYFMDNEFYNIHSDFYLVSVWNLIPIVLMMYLVWSPYGYRWLSIQ